MSAHSICSPAGSDLIATPLHSTLKLAPAMQLPDFRRPVIERKVHPQDKISFWVSETRHLGRFIGEWFCLAFQV